MFSCFSHLSRYFLVALFFLTITVMFSSCSSKHGPRAKNVYPDQIAHKDYYFSFYPNGKYHLKVNLRNDLPFEKHPTLWLYDTHKPPKPAIDIRMDSINYDFVDLAYEHKRRVGSMHELEKIIYNKKELLTEYMRCLVTIYTSSGKYGHFKRFYATCRERDPMLEAHFSISMLEGHSDTLNLDDPLWDRYFEKIVSSMQLIKTEKKESKPQKREEKKLPENVTTTDKHRYPKTEADLRAKPTRQEIEEDDLDL